MIKAEKKGLYKQQDILIKATAEEESAFFFSFPNNYSLPVPKKWKYIFYKMPLLLILDKLEKLLQSV